SSSVSAAAQAEFWWGHRTSTSSRPGAAAAISSPVRGHRAQGGGLAERPGEASPRPKVPTRAAHLQPQRERTSPTLPALDGRACAPRQGNKSKPVKSKRLVSRRNQANPEFKREQRARVRLFPKRIYQIQRQRSIARARAQQQ